jgi:thymidylate synthase (FAD)
MIAFLKESCQHSLMCYRCLLEHNAPPEQARMVLPQNMMTEFIETGSLAAYARLCKLRMGPDAQKEIQDVAKMVSDAMSTKFPATWNVLLQEIGH